MTRGIICLLLLAGILVSGLVPAQETIHPLSQIEYGWGTVKDVAARDSLVFVIAGSLRILDASDPERLVEVGSFYDFRHIFFPIRMALLGQYVIVTGMTGLEIIDVSNPTSPRWAGGIEGVDGNDIAMDGGIAVVTIYLQGILLIDCSDPANPRQVGRWDSPGWASGADVIDHYVYLCDRSDIMNVANTLRVIDIRQPDQPHQAGSLRLPGRNSIDVTVKDTLAFVCCDSDFLIVDISNRRNPVTLFDIRSDFWDAWNSLVVRDSLLYFVHTDSGATIVNFANPREPQLLGAVDLGVDYRYALVDNVLYAVCEYAPVTTISVADPAAPEIISSYLPRGYTQGFDLQGDYAFVAVGGSREEGIFASLEILDVSDPRQPLTVGGVVYTPDEFGEHPEGLLPKDVVVRDSTAYCFGWSWGASLIAYDVTDPTQPSPVAVCSTLWYNPVDIGVGDDWIIMTQFGIGAPISGLAILDRETLREITASDSFEYNYLGRVETAGDLAFVTEENIGVRIIDLADPANPEFLSIISTQYPYNTAVDGLRLYIADSEGMSINDISDPSHPREIGAYNERAVWHVSPAGDFVVICCWDYSLRVLDVRNPGRIVTTGAIDTPGAPNETIVRDGIIYLADWTNFGIYDASEALGVQREVIPKPSSMDLSVFPNPFNSSTTISFSLSKPGRYAVDVVDLSGRLVARLFDGWREAGTYREVLNGGSLASGQYVVSLNVGSSYQLQKVTIIK